MAAMLALFAFDRAAATREVDPPAFAAPPEGRLLQALPLDPSFGRVFVQEWGPPDATPVIIVPGPGAWSGFWRDTARALAESGYRVVALDLPPFGYSDRDPQARYGRADQAARVIGVLDELDACRGILVGHSYGNGPVVEALLRYPHRIVGAVMVSAAMSLPAEGADQAAPQPLIATILDSPGAARMLAAATLANPWLTRHFLTSMVARADAATSERVEVLRRPLHRTGTAVAYAAWLPSVLTPDGAALTRRSDAYRSIQRPVALIWGDADPVAPLSEGQRLAQLIPGASLDVLPGVGHLPHIEAPDETVRVLRGQLERVSPTATARNAPRRLDLDACKLGGVI
ncbi:MAG: alpha/beta hydrolase [Proteobacteria bacterium]|nr:alpha/beta hydrolase [Burkholderiales bacterium]